MDVADRIRHLVAALPSDRSSVVLTRADLAALIEVADAGASIDRAGDLTVDDVAAETRRAPSTVRGWLIAGELRGYKLNRRDWRVPRAALREYLTGQANRMDKVAPQKEEPVDITSWRKLP